MGAGTVNERSYQTNEFAISNDNSFDSFLNAVLHAFWMFPKMQTDIMSFSYKDVNPEEMGKDQKQNAPLIRAI